jgi:protein gp37
MGDLFHRDVLTTHIAQILTVIRENPQHTFMVLTKRAARMRAVMSDLTSVGGPLLNLWLGVSVEDASAADKRINFLLDTPAAVRFVSYEPALAAVDFARWIARLDWIIVGGESGGGARPCQPEAWFRDVVRLGRRHATPVFVKQMGSVWARANNSNTTKGDSMREWPKNLRVREYPHGN